MNSIPFSMILSGIAMLAFGACFGWLYVEIQNKNMAVAEIISEIQSRDGEDIRLEALATLVENTSEERLELDRHFVSSDGVATFLKQVEMLGGETNTKLEIVSVDVKSLTPEDDLYEGLTVALSAEGSFNQVAELITHIEALPYPVVVGQTRFEVRSGDKGKVWGLTTTFTVLKKK